MISLRSQVQAAMQVAFAQVVTCPDGFQAIITRATQPQFGHFQCNSAMTLAKMAKKNPREIAQAVVSALQDSRLERLFSRVEVAGPGFINLWLAPSTITDIANAIRESSDSLGVESSIHPKRVVVDFSSPNVAKEMHVGHLRSTIIGDSLARILNYLGHDVLRLNHIGDWGTAFGMLIAYMKDGAADVLLGEKKAVLSDLMGWYRASKKRFDAEPEFQDQARAQVIALQGGDKAAKKSWQLICDISSEAYTEIYQLLEIEIETRGESFYNPWLPEVVQLLKNKALLEESGGAQCVFLPGFKNKEGNPLPMIVQKSDGGYNYTTTDLAALRHRIEIEKADRLVYVTDAGQSLHFKMLFDCAKKAGFYDESKHQLDHVSFGLVLGVDGKKLKTRSGEVERLIDLLNEAIERAAAIFTERHPDWLLADIQQSAKILGLAAVKYADLSNPRQSDYQFSYDKMLAFDGNTAAFVLYAYVRTRSIQRKLANAPVGLIKITQPAEMDLVIHLLGFSDCLQSVSEELMPNRLTDYIYKTACLFNAFFRDCRVEGVDEQAHRLALVHWTGEVLEKGLELLGIQCLEKM
jgi:arginyl-tRNA synthetase